MFLIQTNTNDVARVKKKQFTLSKHNEQLQKHNILEHNSLEVN